MDNNNRLILLILKEKKIIVASIFVGLVLFVIYLFKFFVPLYSSSVKLFIRNISKQNVVASYGLTNTVKSESGYSNPLFNYVQILRSEQLASSIYKRLDNHYKDDLNALGIKSEEFWYGAYLKLVEAKIQPSTDIIAVDFKWINEKTTNQVFNILIEEYKNSNIQIRKLVETKQREYLDQQLKKITDELSGVREKIKDYKTEFDAIDIDNELRELTRSRVDLEKRLELLKGNIAYLDKKSKELSKQLNIPDAKTALKATGVGEDPYLIRLSQDLAKAQQNYAKLSAKFTDEYSEVIAVKNEIKNIQDNITSRKEETLESIQITRGIYDRPSQNIVTDLARTQADKTSYEAQAKTLESGIKNLRKKERELPAKLMVLKSLQKQENTLAAAYSSIKSKQIEATIKESQIVDNMVILNNPSRPSCSMMPLLMKLVGFLLMGFLGGVALAWIKEDIDDKWVDAKEIEETTGKKVMGVIPWVTSLEDLTKEFIYPSNSILGTAYGNLTNNLISKSYKDDAQVITFISTLITRERTSVIPNIAAHLAEQSRLTVIIDTDFNNPLKLVKEFNNRNESGIQVPNIKKDLIYAINEINKEVRINRNIDNNRIAQILNDSVIKLNIGNHSYDNKEILYLCSAQKVENINDYVASKGFSIIINYLKQYYEFILVDTPTQKPLFFPEMHSLTSISDAVAIVSAMETSKEELVKVINYFEKINVKNLGIISREEDHELEKFYKKQIKQAKEEARVRES